MSLADLVNCPLALSGLEIAELLRCVVSSCGGMIDLQLPSRIYPVIPVDLATGLSRQQLAIEYPYSIDTLIILPALKTLLAAYHLEVTVNFRPGNLLDFSAVRRSAP